MPKYSVRFYSSYVDEYEVEAEDEQEAIDLADEYGQALDFPNNTEELAKFAGKVEVCARHEYVDHDDTCVSELDADGNWKDAA